VRQSRLREDYGLDVITYPNAGKHEEVLELIEYLIAAAGIPHPCPPPAGAPHAADL
jgi:hypothetical protein